MRKGWEGSVWKGKFNVTLVQSRAQALRCSLDMDFAMLREQPDDIFHPLLWKHSGHMELCEVRKRYRIIDRKALRRWFMDVPWPEFREWYIQASNAKWNSREYAEEDWWEKALIVGERAFCERVADSIPESRRALCAYPATDHRARPRRPTCLDHHHLEQLQAKLHPEVQTVNADPDARANQNRPSLTVTISEA